MEICYRFGFDAAHHFDSYPEGHLYRGMHGHSFQVEVALEGAPDPRTGFVTDFGELEQSCGELRATLDHRLLNSIDGLARPSLENIALWLWERLAPRFSTLARVTVRRDSCGQSCTYRGPGTDRSARLKN
jgi:6-pyruvoyltetrahydropterin/6-carboxytetrahydropterin synthase